jgi:hypothetical protein
MDVLTMVTMGILLPLTLLAILVVGLPQWSTRRLPRAVPVVTAPRSHVRVVGPSVSGAVVVQLADRRQHRTEVGNRRPA